MPKGSFTARVVELIGSEATRHLFQEFGGAPLYFPHLPISPDHPIAQTLGHQAALTLCREFGGSRIPIPTGRDIGRRERNAAIVEAYHQGSSNADLAQRFHLSQRTVYYITAAATRR